MVTPQNIEIRTFFDFTMLVPWLFVLPILFFSSKKLRQWIQKKHIGSCSILRSYEYALPNFIHISRNPRVCV